MKICKVGSHAMGFRKVFRGCYDSHCDVGYRALHGTNLNSPPVPKRKLVILRKWKSLFRIFRKWEGVEE